MSDEYADACDWWESLDPEHQVDLILKLYRRVKEQ